MVKRPYLAFALGLLLAGCAPAAPETPVLAVGQPFPQFMLDFVASGHAPASAPKGKILVLNVWASWCGPCRREMPSLERLSHRLDPARFAVVGVSTDDDALLAEEFLRQYGISFTNLIDRGGVAARRLGLPAYPDTFVIAPDGTLLRHMTGLHEWDSPAIVSMLNGLAPGAAPAATSHPEP